MPKGSSIAQCKVAVISDIKRSLRLVYLTLPYSKVKLSFTQLEFPNLIYTPLVDNLKFKKLD